MSNAPLSQIVKLTGCKRPCSYKEYKIVNSKEFTQINSPEDQFLLCLWAVSPFTQIEDEVLVYSFESFIAEFGGCLSLFLGVSFMTIWDGVKGVFLWTMKLKKVSFNKLSDI